MTSKQTRDKQGAIILIALIFTIVLSTLVASAFSLVNSEHRSAIRTLNRETAFHIAESGIEIAMCALKNGAVATSSDWSQDGNGNYVYSDNSIQINGPDGRLDISLEVVDSDTGEYLISCLGTVNSGGMEVQRAVESKVTAVIDSITVDTGSGVYKYTIISRKRISLTPVDKDNGDSDIYNDGRYFFATFDSSVDPDPYESLGDGASIVSLGTASDSWVVNLGNPILWGAMMTAGTIPHYNSGMNNSNQLHLNAVIKNDNTSEDVEYVDSDLVVVDSEFEGGINSVDIPTSEAVDHLVVIGQNDKDAVWGNGDSSTISNYNTEALQLAVDGSGLVVGKYENKTYIDTPYFDLGQDLWVAGDVVINTRGRSNISSTIHIPKGASLTIVDNGAGISFASGSSIDNDYAKQFSVLSNAGGEILIQSDVFVGVVDAPYSQVNLNTNGDDVEMFCGAIVAGNFSSTNGCNFFYDSALGSVSSSGNAGVIGSTAVVSVDSWNEIPASEVVYKFVSENNAS